MHRDVEANQRMVRLRMAVIGSTIVRGRKRSCMTSHNGSEPPDLPIDACLCRHGLHGILTLTVSHSCIPKSEGKEQSKVYNDHRERPIRGELSTNPPTHQTKTVNNSSDPSGGTVLAVEKPKKS